MKWHFITSAALGERERGKKKNNPLPGATPVVHIVHSAVIQQQKCAVNAGKQRN